VNRVGALQPMLAWAEDRALLTSTPSADPGAKTGARAEHTSALRSLADHATTSPGLVPKRQTLAVRCRDMRATMPFTTQLRRSGEISCHGEPRHIGKFNHIALTITVCSNVPIRKYKRA
jgi:hypothetical protein